MTMQAGLSPDSIGLEQKLLSVPTGPLCVSKSDSAPVELSLVLPTLNEAGNIERMVLLADSVVRRLQISYELVVVDDDSPDGTWERALRMSPEVPSLRVMRRTGERGLATAVIRGWQAARGEVLGVIDADLQHPPEVLPSLWKEIQSGADLAVASRWVPGGGVSDWSLRRRMISWTAQALGRILLPKVVTRLADPLSGFFLIRRHILAEVTMDPRGYKILIEVMARCGPARIAEVAYTFRERQEEKSKATWNVYVEYIKQLSILRRTMFREKQ